MTRDKDDALERLRGRTLAMESIVTLLLGDYLARYPATAAVCIALLRDTAVNRRAAEMLSDSELRGFREAFEDFIKRVAVEDH